MMTVNLCLNSHWNVSIKKEHLFYSYKKLGREAVPKFSISASRHAFLYHIIIAQAAIHKDLL